MSDFYTLEENQRECKTISKLAHKKKKIDFLYYSTVWSILLIFDCFRFDENTDLRLTPLDSDESFILERLLSCASILFSTEVESSLKLIDEDVSVVISVDCWTRPNELNNCFSLPDDAVEGDSSGNVEGSSLQIDGDGVDFLVTFEGEDDNVWCELEPWLSSRS